MVETVTFLEKKDRETNLVDGFPIYPINIS
jgi:hypothetical protein